MKTKSASGKIGHERHLDHNGVTPQVVEAIRETLQTGSCSPNQSVSILMSLGRKIRNSAYFYEATHCAQGVTDTRACVDTTIKALGALYELTAPA